MAWIESHQELRNHPKLSAVCRTLSVGKAQMIGHLHLLWWWSMDYAMDGDLSKYDRQQIADASEWQGDAEKFVSALFACGFLDDKRGKAHIHDWFDFCGEIVIKRLRRKSDKRQKSADIGSRIAPENAESSPTVPDQTLPDLTKPTNGVGAEPQTAAPPALPVHPWLMGLELYEGDQKLRERIWKVDKAWMAAFPGVDIGALIKRLHAWELANPSRRKVDRVKFFNNRLASEQDRGGYRGASEGSRRAPNQHVTRESEKYAGVSR